VKNVVTVTRVLIFSISIAQLAEKDQRPFHHVSSGGTTEEARPLVRLALCGLFRASTLMFKWQEGHKDCKNPFQ